jgi:Tfp pilus assembly protein PilZ
MMTPPRRAHDRLPIDLEVTVKVGGVVSTAAARNISQGGMFIEVDYVPIGETIRVVFDLPDLPAPVDAEARVCWSERDGRQGIGVQFVGLRAIEVWAINQLFRRASRGAL